MMQEEEINEEYENQIINEEYKVWKKNSPFLYDLVISHELTWSSLTVEWLPFREIDQGKEFSIQKLIIGTHTCGQDNNLLIIAKVKLPLEESTVDISEYQIGNKEVGGIGGATGDNKIQYEKQILHDGEINRARYMPQPPNIVPNIIATKNINGEVHIFDLLKHPNEPPKDQTESKPQLKLIGHTGEGYGLSWNQNREGHILSAGYDNKICYWDINKPPSEQLTLKPLQENEYHKGNVEDICWNKFNPDIFGSVSDDRSIAIWDSRQDFKSPATHVIAAHLGEVYSIDFNPFNEHLFLTSSEDKCVVLWDLRKLPKRLHSFEGHSDSVIKTQWSPFNISVFASISYDRRVIIWDLAKCDGSKIKNEYEQDGPPELRFIHGGHRAKVNDFSWNSERKDQLVVASVDETNILQIWQMASNIYEDSSSDQEDEQNAEKEI